MGFFSFIPFVGSAIDAAVGAISNNQSNKAQERINRQNIAWQREALGINKRNSLEMWNLQNEYNTPQAQMKRFTEAGLNPNLIYGQGSPGNASPVHTPELGTPDLKPKNYNALASGVRSSISDYVNLSMNKAQVENVRANTLVAQAAAAAKLVDSARTKQQMKLTDSLWDTTVEKARADVRRAYTENDLLSEKWVGEANKNTVFTRMMKRGIPLEQAVENLAKTKLGNKQARVLTDNLVKSGKLKDLEIEMRKAGMSYSDPLWSRVLMRVIGGENINSVIDSVRDMFSFKLFK